MLTRLITRDRNKRTLIGEPKACEFIGVNWDGAMVFCEQLTEVNRCVE